MFSLVNNIYTYVDSQMTILQEQGPLFFILEKLQDRNPLSVSLEYQKQSKALTKRIAVLKGIRRHFQAKLKQCEDEKLRNTSHVLNARIRELGNTLDYLRRQKNGQIILKCASPCNFVIPGAGEALRVTAYSIKVMNAANFYLKQGCLEEMTQVVKELTLAGSLSVTTSFLHGQIQTIKTYLTYQNFRSLFYY